MQGLPAGLERNARRQARNAGRPEPAPPQPAPGRPPSAPVTGPARFVAAPGAQVIVVPLRANVNLKSVTVEELVERRKVRAGRGGLRGRGGEGG